MEDDKALDFTSIIIGMIKGKAEGENSLVLDAGEGYTITDPYNDGHLVISIEGVTP